MPNFNCPSLHLWTSICRCRHRTASSASCARALVGIVGVQVHYRFRVRRRQLVFNRSALASGASRKLPRPDEANAETGASPAAQPDQVAGVPFCDLQHGNQPVCSCPDRIRMHLQTISLPSDQKKIRCFLQTTLSRFDQLTAAIDAEIVRRTQHISLSENYTSPAMEARLCFINYAEDYPVTLLRWLQLKSTRWKRLWPRQGAVWCRISDATCSP